ncbi:MAG: hypothetical protein J0M12_06210 [Deltaproteobacteria bacterium]|nr:hypothetical protein [Deltaproteobacteria bacterium]
MAIIRSANARTADQDDGAVFDESAVPFVPAWDLLQSKEERLSDAEAVAVALGLLLLTPHSADQLSPWNIQSRLEAVSRRF